MNATLWWISLGLGVVVTAVVAALLIVLYREAILIRAVVSKIWDVGQRVANNTVHVPLLYRTAEGVEAILGVAGNIARSAGAIETHARGCPGCPQCIMRH
jgi:hypothetical protein